MTGKYRILVVEDEADVQELILLHLRRDGHVAEAADSAEEGLELFAANPYDLAILDWMLPGVSGMELCKRLKGKVPLLMVTARADTADIVLGLEAGADDYLTKPFEIPILLARVRALLRRASGVTAGQPAPTEIRIGNLKLELEAHQVFCGLDKLSLTVSEFKLLAALMTNQGRVLSRDRLIELVQGEGVSVVDRAIDTHVFGLRKKLGACADIIETIRGVGYRVQPKS